MKNRITIQSLRDLDLNSLNEVLADIYRELNRISDSADEITFRSTKDNNKELVINDGEKQYKDITGLTSFGLDIHSEKSKKRDSVKEVLNLENVDNESKTTMFASPTFTGEPISSFIKHSGDTLPIKNNATDHTHVELIGTVDKRAILGFSTGAQHKFLISYNNTIGQTDKL